MKTKVEGEEAWDFDRALKHYRFDIREKAGKIEKKIIQLRKDFSAMLLWQRYKDQKLY